MNNGTILNL